MPDIIVSYFQEKRYEGSPQSMSSKKCEGFSQGLLLKAQKPLFIVPIIGRHLCRLANAHTL